MAEQGGAPRPGSPLDPAVLDHLSGLGLVARTVVEGFMAGHHRSPRRGSSVEFAQHREYVPGDEIRRLDWKIFGRSDRLVVKEFVEESNLDCHIVLDASESMAFGSLAWNKLDYARWIAAGLCHLVLRQRDSAGLVVFDSEERRKLSPGMGAHQRANILGVLEETRASGAKAVGEVLSGLSASLPRKGIVAILSDFLDDPESIVEGLRRLAYAGHEPLLFHLLDPAEANFEFERYLRLDGLEGGGRLVVDPKAIRAAYLEEVRAHRETLAENARALGADIVSITTDESLGVALASYLARRTARARGGRG